MENIRQSDIADQNFSLIYMLHSNWIEQRRRYKSYCHTADFHMFVDKFRGAEMHGTRTM